MTSQTKICQNCKGSFLIEQDDLTFYEKIKVPPPTWCPECRMFRRFCFYNQRKFFQGKDFLNGKEILAGVHPESGIKTYERDYWWSDAWDPMVYGRDYDFAKPFFAQFKELLYAVPQPSRNTTQLVNSDYCNHAYWVKNSYLSFDIGDAENTAYVVRAEYIKDSLDLYEAFHTELSYENYMSDEVYKVFFSINCEKCSDVWFSRNLAGCTNCFGCINLRGKSRYIFNKPHTKDSYERFMTDFQSGSFRAIEEMRKQTKEFWKTYPLKYTLSINTENSIGEHIERSKNLKYCYSVHECENLAYSQFIDPPGADSYDASSNFCDFSLMYEVMIGGLQSYGLKFCWNCWSSNNNLEYSAFCRSSSELFGCVGLNNKQYCVLNKQYTKEDYFALREKIVKHMNEVPFVGNGNLVYKYGEFFPPDFSPYAYNETIAHDFFPLTKDKAEKKGFLWREPEVKEYQITIKASELPDSIADVADDILNTIIGCAKCERAYRIIPMELEFYRNQKLPLPRLCPDCRFQERLKFVNSPRWRHAKCQCAGNGDDRSIYTNQVAHFHESNRCPNEFETSYAQDRAEIVYCERCYNAEVV